MWARTVVLGSLAGLVAGGALAQSATPVPIDQAGRFTLERTDKGMLRLDRTTGAVSYCTERGEGWTCVLVADDRDALEQEIGRLQAENRKLREDLAAAGQTPGVVAPEDKGAGPEGSPPAAMPGEEEVDQFMDFAERMMRRFFGMVDRLKKEQDGDPI
ncbi:MAG: hypothetical protein R3D02_12890 [Hyphomicrobiales bacterium]